MTHHMTDERLAELRGLRIEQDMDGVSIHDLRSLLARLDAAEELIREVANSGVEFDDHRLNWIAAQIGRDTFAKCRSYLR